MTFDEVVFTTRDVPVDSFFEFAILTGVLNSGGNESFGRVVLISVSFGLKGLTGANKPLQEETSPDDRKADRSC